MKRAPAIRQVPRQRVALVLLAAWSICGTWDASHAAAHAFEHADLGHHVTLHLECQATSEIALEDGGHGHDHPDEDSVLPGASKGRSSA